VSVPVGQADVLRSDWLERILRDAQVPKRVFPLGVTLEVDDAAVMPSAQVGGWHRYLSIALSSTAAQHVESNRVLPEVEVRLRLDAKLVSPSVLKVSMPTSHPIVPVILGAAGHRHGRVKLDLRIAERDECLYVARVERLYGAAVEVDVLLRHRPRSIPQGQESA
jgi:hypothetical protein